ncbi:MAG TPA: LysM peptidoglycan-binding domain-containing protein [Steroidobacteraceae bacterium]|nr:LysM peptidoglycan-binding domain-containing protein [Steroidobacteraceae bacterium]
MELTLWQTSRTLRARAIHLILLTGLIVGCSSSGAKKDSAEPPPPAEPAASMPAAPSAAGSEVTAPAQTAPMPADQQASGPVLAANAPKTYTVQKGDTLWDISSTFLRDPWLWPEIWQVNPQVENPHLIYPGDTLTLAYGADGTPELRLERGAGAKLSPRMRGEPLQGAITAIPYEIVAAFMSKPSVLEKGEAKASPYVVASREQHLAAATGNTIYAKGKLDGEAGSRFNVIHVGAPLVDPDDNHLVGYEGVYTGAARMVEQGDPSTLLLTESTRETLDGDLVFPGTFDTPLDFIPHPPAGKVDGQIISIVNALSMVGKYQVVVINRGSSHGLEPGHVLAIYHAGSRVKDPKSRGVSSTGGIGGNVQLPDWKAGTFMVFKTYDRISYGLVMESEVPIRNFDRVTNP